MQSQRHQALQSRLRLLNLNDCDTSILQQHTVVKQKMRFRHFIEKTLHSLNECAIINAEATERMGTIMAEKVESFSKRLRIGLDRKSMTQTELSIRSGVSKSSISRYLKGDWEGKQEAVYALAGALGVSVSWLMGYDVPITGVEAPGTIPAGFEPLPQMTNVPLVGSIACGTPILAEENIKEYIGVPAAWRADFALECHGDSMAPASATATSSASAASRRWSPVRSRPSASGTKPPSSTSTAAATSFSSSRKIPPSARPWSTRAPSWRRWPWKGWRWASAAVWCKKGTFL